MATDRIDSVFNLEKLAQELQSFTDMMQKAGLSLGEVAKSAQQTNESFSKATSIKDASKAMKDADQSARQLTAGEKELEKQTKRLAMMQEESYQKAVGMKKAFSEQSREAQALARAKEILAKPIATVNMSLGEMQRELTNLRNTSFKGIDKEMKAGINARMADLTDRIGKAQGTIKHMAMDTVPLLATSLQSVAAGAQMVIGVMTLAGVESERTRKLQQNMVALIGIVQALKTVEAAYKAQLLTVVKARIVDAVATKAQAIAQKGQTLATTGSTVATRLLGKAMMSLPIFWLIAGMLLLVGGVSALIYAFTKETEAARASRIENEALAKTREKAYSEVSNTIVQTNILIKVIQNEANSMELRKQKLDELNKMMGTNLTLTDNLTVATRAYIDSLMKEAELKAVTDRMAELNAEMNNTYELVEKSKPSFWSFRTHLDSVTTGFNMLSKGVTIFDKEAAEMYGKNYHQRWADNITTSQRDLKTEYEALFGRATDLIEGTTDAVEVHTAAILNLKVQFDEVYQAVDDLIAKTTKRTEEIIEKTKAQKAAVKDLGGAYDQLSRKISELYKEYSNIIASGGTISIQQKQELKNAEDLKKYYDEQIDIHVKNRQAQEMSTKAYKGTNVEIQKQTSYMDAYKAGWEGTTEEIYTAKMAIEDFMYKYQDLMKQTEKSAMNMFASIIEISNNKTEKMLQNAEIEAEAEKNKLDKTLMGEEAYAAAVTKIEDDLRDKRRQAAQEEAKRQKAYALFSILIDSAQSIMKVWAGTGTPWEKILWTALVAAEGVLNYGAVASQPIPAYAKGRDGGKAETAVVGEKGFEIIDTGKGMFLSPNHATLMGLGEGWRVFPHEQSKQMLSSGLEVQELRNLGQKLDNVTMAINSRPEYHTNVTAEGIYHVAVTGNQRTTYIGGLKG